MAMFALEGWTAGVKAEEMRFATPDLARCFGRRRSRGELAAVVSNSAGGPIALRIYPYARRPDATGLDSIGNAEAGPASARAGQQSVGVGSGSLSSDPPPRPLRPSRDQRPRSRGVERRLLGD